MGTWYYQYDASGALTRQTDAKGQVLLMSYDPLDRLTSKGKLSFEDLFDTKSTTNGGQPGEQVTYNYHPQMLVKSAYGNTAGYYYMQNASYDAAGRMTQVVRGPGSLTSSYSYYGWQETVPVLDEDVFQGARLKQMTTLGNPLHPNLQDLSYLYDEAGNVLRILDAANSNQKQCFAYDVLDRLTQATTNGNADLGCTADLGNGNYHQDYSYRDFDGNLFSKSGVGAYNYNDGNHKHAFTSTGNGWTFTYDPNGNMTQRNTGTVLDMSYDAENRLVQVNKDGALHMTNVYDGDGQRVKVIIEGTPNDTVLTYLGNYYEVETIGSASTARSYYYAGSQRLAMRLNADLYYLLGDHLGSTSVSYKADGSDTKTQLYRAWGENRHPTDSALPTMLRYTGQREDSLGIYFYNARWYDQWTGRFLQADTIVPGVGNPGAWDRYAGMLNNPLRYSDPTGHWTEDELEQALGKEWKLKYFGKDVVFYERDKLLAFMLSENTTDPITLELVRGLFEVSFSAHRAG